MKKFSEAVLAPNVHMSKKASPFHPHSQGLVYTPKGKEEVRPIDTADAGYGGATVADAEGGDANPGKASKKAVSPMKMPTLVKPGLDKANEETERQRLQKLRSMAWKNSLKGLGSDYHQALGGSEVYRKDMGGVKRAVMEDEQIDELKKSTLASYAKKATDDVSYHSFTAGTMSSKNPERLAQDKKAMKRQSGVIKAIDRLAKEEVGLDERNMENKAKKDNVVRQVGTHAYIKHGADAGSSYFSSKMTGRKVMSDPKFKSSKIADMYRKLPSMREENDGTEADQGEYGYEGDMAMTQLKSIIRNAKELHDHMEPQTDLPEWVQSKITLAADYIQTAADYWKSEKEEAEQVDEAKAKMTDAHKKIAKQVHRDLKSDEQVSQAYGFRVRQMHNLIRKKYGSNWRALAGINEEVEQVDEAKAVTHEDPLVTVHDKDGMMTHANLSTANHIHGTNVKHTDVHAGPVKVTNSDNNRMTFELSKHHAKMVKEEAKQIDEVTKKEAEAVLGGPVRLKSTVVGGKGQPKTLRNLTTRLAARAMKTGRSVSEEKKSKVPRIGPMEKALEEGEVWDKPMPDSKKQGSLSPEQKAKAKARADRAGRSYPNMIDNMWASKQ